MKPKPPSQMFGGTPRRRAGVALIIILAFVVILTGVILAFFSRSISSRQVSNASASQTKVDLLAAGAADSIIGDLQQEIAMSSSATTITTGTITGTVYTPLTPASMLPQISGTTASITGVPPNLLKWSAYDYSNNGPVKFYVGTSGTIGDATINLSSTAPSLNGRTVSLARWNQHYLLPLASGVDSTPVTGGATGFTPPDWVLVTGNGLPATSWSSSLVTSATNGNAVIGRYAYAIYHEGGLLDVNAAGYPMQASGPLPMLTGSQTGYKANLAFADLTQLSGVSSLSTALQQAFTYNLVGWRNYATSQPTSSFPNYTYASGSNYYSYVISNPTGFLTTGGTSMYNGQTDHMFGSRQELIAFVQKGLGLSGTSLSVLNCLATFTRGLNEPSIAPDPTRPLVQISSAGGNNVYPSTGSSLELVDSTGASNPINPNFLTLRASGAFVRNNGRSAVIGEPFVNKRFALQKLAWLTYLGPSATRTIPSSNPGVGSTNYDMWLLVNTYGISASYLAQGTAANIQNYFGLKWQVDPYPKIRPYGFHDKTYKWYYTGHDYLSASSVSGTMGPISRLGQIAALGASAREPDFFELLKAGVAAGSKAKGAINLTGTAAVALNTSSHGLDPYLIQTPKDQSLDYAIIQLGANIIDQAKCDGYATRIVFNDGGGTAHEFRGVINQPYLYRVTTGDMKLRNEAVTSLTGTQNGPVTSGTITDTGVGMVMQEPTVWNPHDANAPVGSPAPQSFRVVVDSCAPEQEDTSALGYTLFAGSAGNSTNVGSTAATTSTTACPLFSYFPLGKGGAISTLINSSNPVALISSSNYLTFSGSNTALFREPTILAEPNIPSGSNLAINAVGLDYSSVENASGSNAFQTSGGASGFISDSSNPLNTPATVLGTTRYIGIPIGLYPVAWNIPNGAINNFFRAWFVGTTTVNGGGAYITYRLQYQDPNSSDPSGSWVTYDEKYVHVDTLFLQNPLNAGSSGNLFNTTAHNIGSGGIWESFMDPRTSRFCSIFGRNLGSADDTPGATTSLEWVDSANNVLYTERPDQNSGYGMSDDRNTNNTSAEFSSYRDLGWTLNPVANSFLRLGLFAQNSPAITDNGVRFAGTDPGANTTGAGNPEYYADPDGVVRNGMSAYVSGNSNYPASTTLGLPMATAYNPNAPSANQGQSRPYILHRPFRSVAELGYVFSGTPWKNIDFFTPQSGDAPLLDLFTAYETPDPTNNTNPLVAGVVNLNTRQAPVLQALLSGAYVDETNSGLAGTHPITAAEASAIVNGTNGNTATLINRTSSTSGTAGPLQNVGDLVGRWVLTGSPTGTVTSGTYSGASADLTSLYASAMAGSGTSTALTMANVQRFHEAAIRPLVAVGNTRVWNLMIDVIAQTGRYPQTATGPSYFMVDGEQRYWVHVAIDRFTGQILDKQVEVVKE